MASTPRNGVADLNLDDDDSIKKMSEVAKFARQNNIPGYRPNGHGRPQAPPKQRSENSIRETPMSALRRRLSGWFGLGASTSKPPRRANSLPGKISRDDSEHALSELKQSLSQSPRWQRRRKSVPEAPGSVFIYQSHGQHPAEMIALIGMGAPDDEGLFGATAWREFAGRARSASRRCEARRCPRRARRSRRRRASSRRAHRRGAAAPRPPRPPRHPAVWSTAAALG